ncbi:hypothetical protein [Rhodococcus sp. NPDC060176]|uniref:hypothetical protein n=1 Tax=Rhodococcus sp. NPDC060176 TaxID=3347062 RepID=UPI003652C3D5
MTESSDMNITMNRAYIGTQSTVTYDPRSETVTFEHRGRSLPKKKRQASPWTVQVGSIEGISWREATTTKPAEMRLLLRGRVGYDKDSQADFNYISGDEPIRELVDAINAAVQSASPVAPPAVAGDAPKRPASRPAAKTVTVGSVKPPQPITEFGGVQLFQKVLVHQGQRYAVAGATAFVEVGGTQRRTTATRMAVGTAILPGVGTIIGAMAKKKTNKIFLTVELSDGKLIFVEAHSRNEAAARKFAASVSAAGRAGH